MLLTFIFFLEEMRELFVEKDMLPLLLLYTDLSLVNSLPEGFVDVGKWRENLGPRFDLFEPLEIENVIRLLGVFHQVSCNGTIIP